jgi:hypothetical protein
MDLRRWLLTESGTTFQVCMVVGSFVALSASGILWREYLGAFQEVADGIFWRGTLRPRPFGGVCRSGRQCSLLCCARLSCRKQLAVMQR